MSTQRGQEVAVIRDTLHKMEGEFQMVLPAHIPVERFIRVVMTAVQSEPELIKCDRRSLFRAAVLAAQDGLLPDGRDGAIVPYKDKRRQMVIAQWMPMVSGILKRVRNSGELVNLTVGIYREGDHFLWQQGDDEKIEHRPALNTNGKLVAAYAIAKVKDGGIYREVMDRTEIDKVRNASRASDSGPWVTWYEEMAKKTVIRRLCKRLPNANDLDDLVRRDDTLYEFGRQEPEQAMVERRAAMMRQIANPLGDEIADIAQHDDETGANDTIETSGTTEGNASPEVEGAGAVAGSERAAPAPAVIVQTGPTGPREEGPDEQEGIDSSKLKGTEREAWDRGWQDYKAGVKVCAKIKNSERLLELWRDGWMAAADASPNPDTPEAAT
jgi:recombination protein RecT